MQQRGLDARLGIAQQGLALREQRAAGGGGRGGGGGGGAPAAAAPGAPGGPFAGRGLTTQLLNVLLTGDPSTPEYAAAYATLGQSRVVNGAEVRPDMSPYRTPTAAPQGAVPAPGAPEAAAAPAAASAPAAEAPVAGGRNFGRVEVTPRPQAQSAPVNAADRTKLRNIETEASGILTALDDFKKAREGAGRGERLRSSAGLPTALNSAYNNAALLAKGEALYNLGVLNGPDLSIIRRTIADPGTISGGIFTDQATVNAQVDQVKKLLNDRLATARQQYGGAGSGGGQAAPSGGGERPPLSSFQR
jgi:hypothetical protein